MTSTPSSASAMSEVTVSTGTNPSSRPSAWMPPRSRTGARWWSCVRCAYRETRCPWLAHSYATASPPPPAPSTATFMRRSFVLGVPFRLRLCLGLHLGKAGVVVRELVQVGPRDLRRHDDVVVGDIRLRIARAMLELHVHSHPELLEIKRRGAPVDADPFRCRSHPARRSRGRRTRRR